MFRGIYIFYIFHFFFHFYPFFYPKFSSFYPNFYHFYPQIFIIFIPKFKFLFKSQKTGLTEGLLGSPTRCPQVLRRFTRRSRTLACDCQGRFQGTAVLFAGLLAASYGEKELRRGEVAWLIPAVRVVMLEMLAFTPSGRAARPSLPTTVEASEGALEEVVDDMVPTDTWGLRSRLPMTGVWSMSKVNSIVRPHMKGDIKKNLKKIKKGEKRFSFFSEKLKI